MDYVKIQLRKSPEQSGYGFRIGSGRLRSVFRTVGNDACLPAYTDISHAQLFQSGCFRGYIIRGSRQRFSFKRFDAVRTSSGSISVTAAVGLDFRNERLGKILMLFHDIRTQKHPPVPFFQGAQPFAHFLSGDSVIKRSGGIPFHGEIERC